MVDASLDLIHRARLPLRAMSIAFHPRTRERTQSGQHYRAIGEVWGTSAGGKPQAIAWLGGMVAPVDGVLSLGFDERWFVLAGAKGPFELRNLRIEDADNFVTVASAERMSLDVPVLRRVPGHPKSSSTKA